MKHLTTIAIALALAFGAQAASKEATAHMADSAYRVANYTEAINLYEQVLAEGYTSAELYYNLGNAYYRNDQLGRAILNYQRALRLRPSMTDAKENLALAESRTADRITELPQLFIVRWVNALTDHVSPATWRTVLILLTALIAAAIVLLLLGRTIGIRKGAFIGIIAATVLWLLVLALSIGSSRHFNAHAEAVVLDAAISVKGSPEWQSVDKLILHEGTTVTITEELTGWYKIRIADGTTGWCEQQSVERI